MKELICSSAAGWPGIIAFVGIQLLPGGSQLLRPWRLWSIRLLFPNPKAKEATPTAAVAAIAKSLNELQRHRQKILTVQTDKCQSITDP
ncbi:MAG: hypothetical protein AB8B04_09665 [Prochlorococcus sp.]